MLSSMKNALATARSRLPNLSGFLERLEAENALSIKKTQNAITRLKYIVCLEKHTCDHVKIWIRQSVICVRALRSRANRKPNPWNLNFA